MNKIILSAVIATGLVAAAPMAAFAEDGTLYFSGEIADVTCTVTGGAGTDGGVGDITVTLPTIGKSALDVDGKRAGDTPFELIVGGTGQTDCTDGKIASLWFETARSPQINASTGNLKNAAAAGGAEFVEVGLLNDANAPINLYTSAGSSKATIAGNTATLKYTAQYVATGGAAGAGPVETNVVYSVSYN